jgi:hypothetical protein
LWWRPATPATFVVPSCFAGHFCGGILLRGPPLWWHPASPATFVVASCFAGHLCGGILLRRPLLWWHPASRATFVVASCFAGHFCGGILLRRPPLWWHPASSATFVVASCYANHFCGGILLRQPLCGLRQPPLWRHPAEPATCVAASCLVYYCRGVFGSSAPKTNFAVTAEAFPKCWNPSPMRTQTTTDTLKRVRRKSHVHSIQCFEGPSRENTEWTQQVVGQAQIPSEPTKRARH